MRRPRAPYAAPTAPTDRVPSLSALCLLLLAEFPDAVHQLPARLSLAAAPPDVLPTGPRPADPRLWATLAQVYAGLPAHWHAYPLPLADAHVPLLQRIPHTPRFSLLTLLDLPACPHLTDASIPALSQLHSLVALDASATSLTSYAVKALAGTMVVDADGRRGPWPLRVLRLRYCTSIDDDVYHHLPKFPLLSVIDLRGTQCRTTNTVFNPSSDTILFHPAPLAAAVDALAGQDLCSSPNTSRLVIATLHHPLRTAPTSIVVPQESYVFVRPKLSRTTQESDYHLQPPSQRIKPPKDDPRDQFYVQPFCDSNRDDRDNNHADFFGDVSSSGLGYDSEEEDAQSDESEFELLALPTAGPSNAPQRPFLAPSLSPPRRSTEAAPETFYRTLPPLDPRRKYDPINDYDAKMYYARVPLEASSRPTSRHDTKLALYRPPPPWTVLEERTAALARERVDVKAKPSSGMITAEVNRSRAMGRGTCKGTPIVDQRRLDELKKGASARMQSSPATPSVGSAPGRNPFRRPSTGTPSAGPSGSGSARVAKPLIPISAVAVPVLPPLHRTPASSASRIKSKGLVASSFSEDPKSKVGTERKVLTPIGRTKSKRPGEDEGASVKKKIKVGDDKKTNSISAGTSKAKGFDWGSWGGGKGEPKDTKK
ncbi:hypothetical protein DXG03_003427 [Asterophora parasitica]|uniref:Uncharacterized protein n=1 Tax=Asterophora parasitica TaxID=117018 RepID=A0A9P7G1I8_9AGAR|nr:hypothetical protein DXG03_003427 [Asterophora parasitica]